MNYQAIPKDVDWFCYHLATDKLLTKEQCITAIEAIEKSKQAVSLRLLKLVILQNKLCQDAAKLDVLSSMSTAEAANGRPPHSVLNPNPPMAQPVAAPLSAPSDVAPLKPRTATAAAAISMAATAAEEGREEDVPEAEYVDDTAESLAGEAPASDDEENPEA